MDASARLCEQFSLLRTKGEKIFVRLRALPPVGAYWEPFFEKAFNTYSKLWKIQQQHRNILESTPTLALKRWEIGELAARIAQLYYHYYLRTSDTSYLQESFTFYSAIRSRGYFKDTPPTPPTSSSSSASSAASASGGASVTPDSTTVIMSPTLAATTSTRQAMARLGAILMRNMRYHARFLLVCLFLGVGNELLDSVVADMSLLVLRYKTECNPSRADSLQWQALLEEIKGFQAHRIPVALREASGKIVPYLDSGRCTSFFPPAPPTVTGGEEGAGATLEQQQQQRANAFKLHAAVIAANKRGQVKFSELTLDMLRIMHSLEKLDALQPQQQPSQRAAAGGQQAGQLQQAREDEEARNPQKYLLYQGSATQIQHHLATLNSMLPQNRVVLLYISADAASDAPDAVGQLPPPSSSTSSSLLASQLAAQGMVRGLRMTADAGRRQNGPSTMLTPGDIVPFTRMPLFMIIESDNSTPFGAMQLPYGEPFVCLMSPQRWEATEPGLYTLFLHAPLAAFCVLCGLRTPDRQLFAQCNSLLGEYLDRVSDVVAGLAPAPAFARFLEDEFLRLFIARHVFCCAALAQFLPSNTKGDAWMPAANPALPFQAVLAHRDVLAIVPRLAALLGVGALFGPAVTVVAAAPSATGAFAVPRPVKPVVASSPGAPVVVPHQPRTPPAAAMISSPHSPAVIQMRMTSAGSTPGSFPGAPPPLPPPPSPVIAASITRTDVPQPPPGNL